MLEWLEYGKLLVALWALVHPVGAVPLFLNLTEKCPAERRHIGSVAAIAVGVFGANWTPQYHWNDTAGSVAVVTAGGPAFKSVASANPTRMASGATAAVTTTVTNTSATGLVNGIVYTEIYGPSGTRVYQSFCSGVIVNSGATTSCRSSWTAPSTAGSYTFQVGVFGANWTPQYHWNSNAGTATVGGASGSSAAAAVASKLGKPTRLLIGLGGNSANEQDVRTQDIKIDIFEHYLAYLSDHDGWPTWNSDAAGSGAFVSVFAMEADRLGAVPMFTLYQMADWGDGQGIEISAVANATFMRMYWPAAKLMFTRLGAYGKPALVNLEPDFWGYAERTSSDPATIYADVQDEGADCAGLSNTVAGMAQCLVRLAHTYAPKTLVGFSPSIWGGNSVQEVASFMVALGAGQGDFVVMQTLDHDAGCFEVQGTNCQRAGSGWYWSTSDFQTNFSNAQTLSQTIGKPLLWWQTPLGVARSEPGGTTNRYRDNRVQYFFAHPSQLVAAGAFGVVFGAGASTDTFITTDGGQFQRATRDYFAAPVPLP